MAKGAAEWDALVKGGKPLAIPAHTTMSADLDARELTTGYLRLSMAGGAGARLTLLQAECYAGDFVPKDDPYKSLPRKGDRTDASLQLYGYTDVYHSAGFGTAERPERYEPYWFRAFRFVRVTVETGDEPLTLLGVDYEETGYPLEVWAKVKTSDPSLGPVWDICERSLRRCMHETYEDCPFYERLQYAMDARSERLYTYAVSSDDRLARKCMDDFTASIRLDDMVNCSAPNYETNVIPGFGVYFIGMVYDHMWWFGSKDVAQRHWGTVERILDFFTQHVDERGLADKIGDVNRLGQFWSFIDWTAGGCEPLVRRRKRPVSGRPGGGAVQPALPGVRGAHRYRSPGAGTAQFGAHPAQPGTVRTVQCGHVLVSVPGAGEVRAVPLCGPPVECLAGDARQAPDHLPGGPPAQPHRLPRLGGAGTV